VKHVRIVGAGLAGATAAALLRESYDVTVYERRATIGGLCRDANGYQECGPHALHTDDADVWEFLQRFATWEPFDLRVFAYTDHTPLAEIPARPGEDPVFRVYSEKAWGLPFDQLPREIRQRVPAVCNDGRTGYHAGRFKGQPTCGYSALIARMLEGATLRMHADPLEWRALRKGEPVIYTGDIADLCDAGAKPRWHGRTWTHTTGALPVPVINYCTHHVPQLRSWDNARFGSFYRAWLGHECADGQTPCYPSLDPADNILAAMAFAAARCEGVFCCGRMGAYRYLDMDATVRNVMDTIERAGL